MLTKTCEYCGKEFQAKRNDKRFCNSTCKSKFWVENRPIEKATKPTSELRGVISQSTKREAISAPSPLFKPYTPSFSAVHIEKLEKEKAGLEQELKVTLENVDGKTIVVGTLLGAELGSRLTKDVFGKIAGGAFGFYCSSWFINDTSEIRKKLAAEKILSLQEQIQLINFRISSQKFLLSKTSANNSSFSQNDKANEPHNTNLFLKNGSSNSQQPFTNYQKRTIALPPDENKPKKADNEKIISSDELLEIEYESFNFTGRWLDFVGSPSTNFNCVIFGKAGEGKSTFAIQFSIYLAEQFGKVLYISGEEGFSKTFKDKFARLGATVDGLYVGDLRSFQDIEAELKKNNFHFYVIDSLDTLKIGPDEMKKLRQMLPKNAFITISQSTKDGKMRGSNELNHDSDIVIEVNAGSAITTKNRFLERGKEFEVF